MPESNINRFSHRYANKIILAPMVKANSLPFRLLCLEEGADLVYSEEIIDHSLSICERIENTQLGTIDFVNTAGRVIFRTHPKERDRLVVQLGSNKPERALSVAKLLEKDVMGIDFNFGCPKAFSLKGGMGAAMLTKPDEIRSLLTSCVENLNIPITCKIRILPTLDETLKLVKMIESCGVAALAVHGRTKDQRSNYECETNFIRAIAECIEIPVIANGGSNKIKTFDDIIKFREITNASSVMIARAAMKNPSIFNQDKFIKPLKTIIPRFLQLAVTYDTYITNTKYSIQAMMPTSLYGGEFVNQFHQFKNYETICELFDMGSWYRNEIVNVRQDDDVVNIKIKNAASSDGADDDEFSCSHRR